MARTVLKKQRAASEAANSRRLRDVTAVLITILGAQTAVEYVATYLVKEPMYNSIFTGAAWVRELLNGHAT